MLKIFNFMLDAYNIKYLSFTGTLTKNQKFTLKIQSAVSDGNERTRIENSKFKG